MSDLVLVDLMRQAWEIVQDGMSWLGKAEMVLYW
jgi:hypothetical protein